MIYSCGLEFTLGPLLTDLKTQAREHEGFLSFVYFFLQSFELILLQQVYS